MCATTASAVSAADGAGTSGSAALPSLRAHLPPTLACDTSATPVPHAITFDTSSGEAPWAEASAAAAAISAGRVIAVTLALVAAATAAALAVPTTPTSAPAPAAAPAALTSPSSSSAYAAPLTAAAGDDAEVTLLRSGKPHPSSSETTDESAPASCSTTGVSVPSISPAAMRKRAAEPASEPAPTTATVTGALVGLESIIAHTKERSSALTLSIVAEKAASDLIRFSTAAYEALGPSLSTAAEMAESSEPSAFTAAALTAMPRLWRSARRPTERAPRTELSIRTKGRL
mmetsp:Transcript_7158/g.18630  ORF Transcript_7158/g.18630 Transcript_7158/m.18630 type:complete len:288 (-) Transcript_7158:7-870(-)